ncbi:MAG: hypothetical protein GEV10_06370 [Streptosporangiales bacterium]|nr:hypothetical protein [Streptosporangiales bacterium]
MRRRKSVFTAPDGVVVPAELRRHPGYGSVEDFRVWHAARKAFAREHGLLDPDRLGEVIDWRRWRAACPPGDGPDPREYLRP